MYSDKSSEERFCWGLWMVGNKATQKVNDQERLCRRVKASTGSWSLTEEWRVKEAEDKVLQSERLTCVRAQNHESYHVWETVGWSQYDWRGSRRQDPDGNCMPCEESGFYFES